MKLSILAATIVIGISACSRSTHATVTAFTITATAGGLPPHEAEFHNHSHLTALISIGHQNVTLPPGSTHRFRGLPDAIQAEFRQLSGSSYVMTNSVPIFTIPHGSLHTIR